MPRPPRILLILTSSATMGAGGEPTGLWFEELAAPFTSFVDAGAAVTLASITGGPAPIDPRSVKPKGENGPSVERFLADASAAAALAATVPLSEVSAEDYDAVFLPGGHGTMWDLPQSEALAGLLGTAWAAGRVVAAVCHGPAGLTGLAPAHVGALMLTYGVLAAIGNGLGGRLTDRFGSDRTVALILAGLVLVLAMIGVLAAFVIPMVILVALLGALTYAAVPALQARVIGLAERHAPRALAAAAGLNIAGFNAGIALGSLLGGGVIAAWDVSATAFVGAGAAASGLGVLAIRRR